MKLSDLKNLINRYPPSQLQEDPEVVVAIKLPYATVGRIPTVSVKNAGMGFDWEAGLFVIRTEENLTPSDRDFAAQMRDMQERSAKADYENRNLKAELNRLKKKLKETE